MFKKPNILKTAVLCYLKSDCYVNYIFEENMNICYSFDKTVSKYINLTCFITASITLRVSRKLM